MPSGLHSKYRNTTSVSIPGNVKGSQAQVEVSLEQERTLQEIQLRGKQLCHHLGHKMSGLYSAGGISGDKKKKMLSGSVPCPTERITTQAPRFLEQGHAICSRITCFLKNNFWCGTWSWKRWGTTWPCSPMAHYGLDSVNPRHNIGRPSNSHVRSKQYIWY